MKEIGILEVGEMKIGHATDEEAATGCTVVLFGNEGAPCAVDVRGGGPASREHALLAPVAAAEMVNAIVLSGGSAFGLASADGVMRYLSERDIGFDTGVAKVPIVPTSCLFDLGIGASDVYPDASRGYEACEDADARSDGGGSQPFEGNVGAGCGCTVGKLLGAGRAMKTGLATYAVELGALKVGAIVAVNALGDICGMDDGRPLAGLLDETGKLVTSSEATLFALTEAHYEEAAMAAGQAAPEAPHATHAHGWGRGGNTTLGIVLTNGLLDKTKLTKVAGMAHDGYARTIRPVHTNLDGDSIYAASVGSVPVDVNAVGALAAYAMGKAVDRAAYAAEGSHGYKSLRDL